MVTYAKELEGRIIQAINAAAADIQDAKIGWGTKPVAMNRNRHSKNEPKPIDSELGVIRLDNQELALVGGSGEFFCEHGIRLKQRSMGAE